jgi:hypothetical protein
LAGVVFFLGFIPTAFAQPTYKLDVKEHLRPLAALTLKGNKLTRTAVKEDPGFRLQYHFKKEGKTAATVEARSHPTLAIPQKQAGTYTVVLELFYPAYKGGTAQKGEFKPVSNVLTFRVEPGAKPNDPVKVVLVSTPKPPGPSASWSAGSLHYLTWDAGQFPATAKIRIDFSRIGGTKWQAITTEAVNSGRFLWKIPDTISKLCKVRISAGNRTTEDTPPFAIIPSQEVKDYQWMNVTAKAAFAPRDGAGALSFRGRMWLLGGWNPGDKKHFPRICNNEVWSSADGVKWTLDKPNAFLDKSFDAARDWEGRHTAGYVVFKDRLWIVGGDVNQGHYHFDVWNSADGKTWQQVNKVRPVPWGPRALHYTVAFRDKIWVIGGQTVPQLAANKEVFYRDVWTSADGIQWQKITPKEPCWSPRGMVGGSAVFKDRIWVLGGGTYDTPKKPKRQFHNDVWSTTDGITWTRHVAQAPWEPRQYHDVAVFDGRLWVMEGYSEGKGNRSDVWYSADGANWYEMPNTPWKPRHAASVFVHAGALWMVAGNNMESDVWKLQRRQTKK